MGINEDLIKEEIAKIDTTKILTKPSKDLAGQKFGRLKVICQSEDYVSLKNIHKIKWLCLCDCDTFTKVQSSALGKLTFSCGCLMKEQNSNTCRNNFKKYNTYDLTGEYGVGYTSKGEEFYFDLEDYEKIKDYCWYADKDGFIVTNDYSTYQNRRLALHRYIMNMKNDWSKEVDHKRHNRHDARKAVLRLATPSENSYNTCIPCNNTSGIKGVSWCQERNKWVAYINVDCKRITLGRFDKLEDAVNIRIKAEKQYHKEWSYEVSMKEG